MSQHFLLSTKARTLSLAKVMRLSETEAYETFRSVRWADNDGQAYCPRCGSVECYEYKSRRIFKCKGCGRQFSVTTETIFASHKMDLRDILAAIAIFVNGAKGHSALQMSREVIFGALREAKRPMTGVELTQHVMAERGMNTADKGMVKTVGKRVGSCLRHHRLKGILKSSEGPDGLLLWEFAK